MDDILLPDKLEVPEKSRSLFKILPLTHVARRIDLSLWHQSSLFRVDLEYEYLFPEIAAGYS